MLLALLIGAFAAIAVGLALSQWNKRSTETASSVTTANRSKPPQPTEKLSRTPKAPSVPVDQRLKVGADYQLDELYVSKDDGTILGLNFSQHQLLLGTLQSPICHHFGDIAGAELQRNGVTLTQTNRGSQLVGAAIGGAAFGGAGALAGALTGSSRSTERVSSLQIAVTVDDWAIPLHKVTFIRSKKAKGLDPANADVARILALAETLYAHLTLAMRNATNKSDQPAEVETTQVPTGAQELEPFRDPMFAVNVADWGPTGATVLWHAVHEARPELTLQEAILAAHPMWKPAPTTVWVASAGEARRLRSALTTAGASVSDA